MHQKELPGPHLRILIEGNTLSPTFRPARTPRPKPVRRADGPARRMSSGLV